jgi:hypothetical protein
VQKQNYKTIKLYVQQQVIPHPYCHRVHLPVVIVVNYGTFTLYVDIVIFKPALPNLLHTCAYMLSPLCINFVGIR